MFADLRHALRRWRHRPAFAATTILTLAVGIAATTALYSFVDAVLLRPLPWFEPDRIVVVHAADPARLERPSTAATWNRAPISWAAWQQLKDSPVFDSFGVWYPLRYALGPANDEAVSVHYVSSGFLRVFRAEPALGHNFGPGDDLASSSATAIISHELWQKHFNGRPDIVGQLLRLESNSPKTIIGVLPPRFTFQGESPQVLMAIGVMESAQYNDLLRVVARLRPGVSIVSAHSVAEPIIRGAVNPNRYARLVPLAEEELGQAARPLWLLFAGAGLLLVVACANVAGLLLGDARTRRHEVAVRAALGGGRLRLLRQLTVEHGLLAMVAAVLGVVLAVWLTPLLVALAPSGLPRLESVNVDGRIAGLALALSGVTALVFGLAPTLALLRTSTRQLLAEGARDAGPSRLFGQRAIVAGELALALVLLVAASLFGETMYRLTSRPLGFDPSQLAVVSTTFTGDPTGGVGRELMQRIRAGGMDPIEAGRLRSEALLTGRARVADAAVNRLAAMPSVISAAAVSEVPFATAPVYTVSRFEGRPDTEQVRVQRQIVNESYFETMRLRVMRGRVFQIQDRQGAPVAVVSREFERRHLNGNALGRRLKLGPPPTSPRAVQRVHEVIGVVDDVKHREFADEDQATIYVFNWHGGDVRHLLVRSSGEMSTLVPQLRRVLREHDPRLVVTLATSMEGLVADSVAEERLRAALSAMFGGTALLLSAMGLYGLAARRVIDRRREIGVRMALGAEPGHVRRLVLRDSLSMAAFGLAIGLPAAYFASRVGQAFLYGVSATSPHIFISAGAILALAAMTAAFFPALRAGRIDPSIALRDQP